MARYAGEDTVVEKVCRELPDDSAEVLAENMLSSSSEEEDMEPERIGQQPAVGGQEPAVGGQEPSTGFLDKDSMAGWSVIKKRIMTQRNQNWIIVRDKISGTWKFSKIAVFNKVWRGRLLRKMPFRSKFLMYMEEIWGTSLVQGEPEDKVVSESLQVLFEQCKGRLWDLKVGEYSDIVEELPAEMFVKCSFDDFRAQYERVLEWMRSVRNMPYGHEFYKLSKHWVQKIDYHDKLIGRPFVVSRESIRQASHWQPRWVPAAMTKISCHAQGACRFLHAETVPDMDKFYAYAMSTQLEEIRARHVWHAVIGWHFYMHAATSSQSLSESVGSFLQEIRQSRSNQGPPIEAVDSIFTASQ